MRIAMLHWAFPPIIGGVESHLALLCPYLVQQGHQVSLLTATAPGAPERESWRGVTIKRSTLLDLNSLTPETIEARAGEIKHLLESFLLECRPDIVHAHNFHYFSFVHAASLQEICRRHGWPLILTAHNVWEDELWAKMNTLAQGWDQIIAVSHYIRQELMVNGYPPERLTVVYHGTDTATFRPPTPAELQSIYATYPEWRGRRLIFHPARMSRAKGCDVSIRALDLVRREIPNVLLILAGTTNTVDWGQKQPGEVAWIQELITSLGLEKNVFIRFFPWQEIPAVYKAAEVCLYPSSFQEPFGLVMLEAMATARPIIVSRAGGMPEIIRPGYNGFLVSMGNYQELARYTTFLLRNPEVGTAMGQNGRRLAEEDFTTAVMARNTLAVYSQLLALPRAS
ncbi:glycosyl transferase [Moorella sp. E308F]|uniref:glycosyltransferase family 4 protein n=1 Tax=unclassified Neomoorella TaxID=2676739 RepID=UPI0010FFB911|nr:MULTISPECIES: glycosyltransferase family 4 protein [unclassified Moorella (in: firmicutes)]GEA15805.1 glycosyl transferase [Moorella sp. E308F]GEA19364.1 glycosyl transferase [Moorella sp. E306M]